MPIYPEVKRTEGTFIQTVDPDTFIESITPTADPDAPEIVYVQFKSGHLTGPRRWKMTGNCNRCGIADFEEEEDGSRKADPGIVLQPGKSFGEIDSVIDVNYETRLDIPCAPGYDGSARWIAADMGIPYVCGLRFEELRWIY